MSDGPLSSGTGVIIIGAPTTLTVPPESPSELHGFGRVLKFRETLIIHNVVGSNRTITIITQYRKVQIVLIVINRVVRGTKLIRPLVESKNVW
jgi:hypothetical protein